MVQCSDHIFETLMDSGKGWRDMDIDGQQLADQISGYLAEKAWEHAEKYNNHFCWNCGKGVTGKKQCPSCGAVTNGPARFQYPCYPHNPGWVTSLHPSIWRYRIRSIIAMAIFGVLFSVGLCAFMFISGELEMDTEGMRNMSYILVIIWVFWLAWFIIDFFNTGKKLRAARAFNRSMGGEFICAMCETHTQHPANYCGLCGCALPK